MLKLIDLSYNADAGFETLQELVRQYNATLAYANFIDNRIDLSVIKHISKPDKMVLKGVNYFGFTTKNHFLHIPFTTHKFIKSLRPDAVLVQGFVFPFQVIMLRLLLGKKPIIILQYHGGKPAKMPKLLLQKIADKFVDAYFFTSREMANQWIKQGVISAKKKCLELPEGSTFFKKKDKAACKQKLGFEGNYNFLWVGRLNANKDPFTILTGFEKYLGINPGAKLYMIYQATDLLIQVEQAINSSNLLKNAVKLVGSVAHSQLEDWYNAADFYISGSHHEGSGFALFESMACGCIPIVSHILPFRKMLSDGKFGILFETGNADDLFQKLKMLENINREILSNKIAAHFQETMSHKAIADKLVEHVASLVK